MKDVCTIIFGGDIAPIEQIEKRILNEELCLFDKKISQIIRESDFFIANLELPLTNNTQKRLKTGMNLKCDPKISNKLSQAGINVLSLANNHIFDYGEKGVQDTLNTLSNQKIKYYGIGENSLAASQPLYLQCKNLKIGLLTYAEHEFNWQGDDKWCTSMLEPALNILQIIKTKNNCDKLIIFLHGGPENWHYPSPRMATNAHAFIDAGADTVIYTHAHAVMGKEIYKEKSIFYGLGNLIFPIKSNIDYWNKGILVKLDITESNSIQYDIIHTQFNKDSDVLVSCNENKKEDEFFKLISKEIKDSRKLEQKWDMFSNIQKKKLFHEIIKGIFAMLPFLILGNFLSTKKLKILYIKGVTLIRGLLYCENHFDVLKNIFDKARNK